MAKVGLPSPFLFPLFTINIFTIANKHQLNTSLTHKLKNYSIVTSGTKREEASKLA
jgi:hypothetical protein